MGRDSWHALIGREGVGNARQDEEDEREEEEESDFCDMRSALLQGRSEGVAGGGDPLTLAAAAGSGAAAAGAMGLLHPHARGAAAHRRKR